MAEGRIDDEMIEISDPNDETVGVEPPPRVVIEYRDRGVPWMLIPPLLILSAVGAVVGYHKMARDDGPPRAVTVATAPELPTVDIAAELAKIEPPSTVPAAEAKPVEPPSVAIEAPADPVTLPPVVAAEPAVPIVPPAEPAPPAGPEKPAEESRFPKVTGVGFDPKAFEAAKKEEAPPADPAITPVARQEPARVAPPVDPNLPTEVDPDLLPPDPRLARVRQQERAIEAIKQVELDRTRFHNDLREICRIARDDYIKEVIELSNRYGMQLDPNVKKEAIKRLGETGRYAGADRRTRIEILREIGYPETLVLEDLFDHYEKLRIGERNGPRNPSEAMYRSILSLLRYAPGQKTTPARPTIARPPQTSIPAPPAPAFFSNPGTR